MNNSIVMYLDNQIQSYRECYDFISACLEKKKKRKFVIKNTIPIELNESESEKVLSREVWLKFKEKPDNIPILTKPIYIDKVILLVNVNDDVNDLCQLVLLWQIFKKINKISLYIILYNKNDQNCYFKTSYFLANIDFEKKLYWGEGKIIKSLAKLDLKSIKVIPLEVISYQDIIKIWNVRYDVFLRNLCKSLTNAIGYEINEDELLLAAAPKDIQKNIEFSKKYTNIDNKRIDAIRKNGGREFHYIQSVLNYFSKDCIDNFNYFMELMRTVLIRENPMMSLYLLGGLFYFRDYENLIKYHKGESSELEHDLIFTKDIVDGIIQLLENTIIHASPDVGLFSMRLSTENSITNFQFWVGDHSSSNMLKKFRVTVSNINKEQSDYWLVEDNVKKLNEIVSAIPKNDLSFLFDSENDKSKTWEDYSKLPGVMAHHYGLKLFQSLVEYNNGNFSVQSHGLVYSTGGSHYKKQPILPGTQYSIELPIQHSTKMTSTGIDANIDYTNVMDLDYVLKKGFEYDRDFSLDVYNTVETDLTFIGSTVAQQKEEYTNRVANKIIELVEQQEKTIIIFNASKVLLNRIEILCKAIVIYMTTTNKTNNHFAFINCSDYFIVEMVRMFSVFYGKNGQFKYIKDTQIYFSGGKENASLEFLLAGTSLRSIVANAKKYAFISGVYPKSIKYLESILQKRLEVIKTKDSADSVTFVPFDLLCHDYKYDITEDRNEKSKLIPKTLFEYKVEQILKRDIQSEEWGYYLHDIHIRLGKEIHMNGFYEAELLFHNNLYTYRFSRLLVNEIEPILMQYPTSNCVLVGYETYSEMLLYEVYKMMVNKNESNKDRLSYLVYEQKQVSKIYDNSNKDRDDAESFRYIKYANGKINAEIYENAVFIIIVPIGTTLMTFHKIRQLLKANLQINNFTSFNLTLILVKSDKDEKLMNYYWKGKENREIITNKLDQIKVKYFIDIKSTWFNACTCSSCFPRSNEMQKESTSIYLKELPLFDTNRASVVPMVKFGRYKHERGKTIERFELYTGDNESRIEQLKNYLIYGHVERNGNHFMYYIKTEDLFHYNRKDIQNWLSELQIKTRQNENEFIYDFIVAPMHYSNTGFIEEVNDLVFQNGSYILCLEVNKEFRNNIKAKFSNLSMLYYNLKNENRVARLRFHYIDDMIVTGKTFYRMKSLIHSIFPEEAFDISNNVHVDLFDNIILLLNRNSIQSIRNYTKDLFSFHAYINLNISMMRSFEDACVMCKNMEDSQKLLTSCATTEMYSHWKYQIIKYRLHSMHLGYVNKNSKDRAFLRMQCTHRANVLFELEDIDINEKEDILKQICYMVASSIGFDEVLSYIKVLSRPFFTYHKVIKNAIFEFNLFILHYLLFGRVNMSNAEGYNYEPTFYAISQLADFNKDKLIEIILASLAGLESNFIMRKEFMRNYYEKYKENDYMLFKYQAFIKKIICTNNDEAKSLWLEHLLVRGNEIHQDMDASDEVFINTYGINSSFGQALLLENTTLLRSIIHRLYQKLQPVSEFGKDKSSSLKNKIYSILMKDKNDTLYDEYYYIHRYIEVAKFLSAEDITNMLTLTHHLKNYKQGAGETDIIDFYHDLIMYSARIMNSSKAYMIIAARNKETNKIIEDEYNIICYFDEETPNRKVININVVTEFTNLSEIVKKLFVNIKKNSYTEEDGYILIKFDNTLIEDVQGKSKMINVEDKMFNFPHNSKPIYMLFKRSSKDDDRQSNLLSGKALSALRNLLSFRTDIMDTIIVDFDNDNIQLLCERQEKMNMLSNIRAIAHCDEDDYGTIFNDMKNDGDKLKYSMDYLEFFFNTLIAVAYNRYLQEGDRSYASMNFEEENVKKYVAPIKNMVKLYMKDKDIKFVDKAGDDIDEQNFFPKEIEDANIRVKDKKTKSTFDLKYFAAFLIDMLKSARKYAVKENGYYIIRVEKIDSIVKFSNLINCNNFNVDKENMRLDTSLKGKGNGISLSIARKFFVRNEIQDKEFFAYYKKENNQIRYSVEWPILKGEKNETDNFDHRK